jgi:hypothetical protein
VISSCCEPWCFAQTEFLKPVNCGVAVELTGYKQMVEQLEIERESLRESLHETTAVLDSAQVLLTENMRLTKLVGEVSLHFPCKQG